MVKNPPANTGNPRVGKIPRRRKWQSTPVFLPGKSHGQKNLAGYNSWGCKELDTTDKLHRHANLLASAWKGCSGSFLESPSSQLVPTEVLRASWMLAGL